MTTHVRDRVDTQASQTLLYSSSRQQITFNPVIGEDYTQFTLSSFQTLL